jgi:hypothetical protein
MNLDGVIVPVSEARNIEDRVDEIHRKKWKSGKLSMDMKHLVRWDELLLFLLNWHPLLPPHGGYWRWSCRCPDPNNHSSRAKEHCNGGWSYTGREEEFMWEMTKWRWLKDPDTSLATIAKELHTEL